jgi:hypothetical protein
VEVSVSQHYVCVTGGRDFADASSMAELFNFLHLFYAEKLRVMHGAAPGADRMADSMALQLEIPVRPFPADWDRHGKPAGAIRNGQMVDYLKMCRRKEHTVQVVAFPGGDGTADMIRQSEKAAIDVDRWGWE